jgi:hypothetical protein
MKATCCWHPRGDGLAGRRRGWQRAGQDRDRRTARRRTAVFGAQGLLLLGGSDGTLHLDFPALECTLQRVRGTMLQRGKRELKRTPQEGSYVARYREKRRRYLESRTHFMEIDLLRGGENPARDLFPELPESAYFLFVARKTDLGRNEEGYPISLRDPLPVVGLPLGSPRPDLPLDLAAAFRSAYDLSVRPGSIRYRDETPPPPPLDEDDARWVREMVAATAQ